MNPPWVRLRRREQTEHRAGRGGRARPFAVALALVFSLGACGGLPSSGPLVQGSRLGEPVQDPVRVSVQGPVDGASPTSMARGFVLAGGDTDETHQTGKEFLTPQSVDLWRWSSGDIIVYDSLSDGLSVRASGPERVTVSVKAIARVSPQGRYEEVAPGTTITTEFAVTKVDGQWRLQLPPAGFGLWLDSNAFDRLYINDNIYYVTLTGRQLVPDSRWFPAGSRLTTALARAQLEPVPAYLEGSVFTGVPPQAKLAVNSVPVDPSSGRAVVDLNAAALAADPDARTAMWAQLTATLSQVPSVEQVALTAETATLELPSGRLSATTPDELGFAAPPSPSYPTALLRTGADLRRIDPRFIPDSSVGPRLPDTKRLPIDVTSVPVGWTRLALSSDGKVVAAVSGDSKDLSLWQAGRAPLIMARFATELTRPAYDTSGYLWVGALSPDGVPEIVAFAPAVGSVAPRPVVVKAPWLVDRRVVSLNVSPDGARLLVVTERSDGTSPRLDVSGIARAANGQPTTLALPLREAQPLTLIRDAVWLDTSGYAVLGRIDSKEPVRPWVGSLGTGLQGLRRRGTPEPSVIRLAAVAEGVSLTSVGGPRGLIVITSDDRVLARAGLSWREIAKGSNLLVPGR